MLTGEGDGAAPPDAATDRRAGGTRHRSVLLVGKVRRGGREDACLVHDLSRHGLMARFTDVPTVGEALIVEVRGLPAATATVRWVKGNKAGVQFMEAQPIDGVFRGQAADGPPARPPRFALDGRAVARIGGERFDAEILDISAGGVKLAAERPVHAGQTGRIVLIAADGDGVALFGMVCWTAGDRFGFRFTAPLPIDTLARILPG